MTLDLELAANAVITVSILLAARNSVHTWWTGIVGCVLFALVFHGAKLYAEVGLQGFFIATSAWGWWQWSRVGARPALPIKRAGMPRVSVAVVVALLTTLAYAGLLWHYTDAAAPLADSAVTAFSVLAQLLLMQRRLETWPCWLLVNTIAVPLYLSRGLHVTAVLYAVYWCNAWYGWWRWQRQMQRKAAA
jgi:nicotinamide mononucleotide transporter